MPSFSQTPKALLRLIHYPPQFAYAIGLGPLIGKLVLLITTTGRKSGKPRVTPLQYEKIDGDYYLGAARGYKSDWVRNIQHNPLVKIRVKSKQFEGYAKIITDPTQIAMFLAYRYQRHPRMMTSMLQGEGLSMPPKRSELENYAKNLVMVIVHPQE